MMLLARFIVGVVLTIAGYRMGDVTGLFLMAGAAALATSAAVGFISSRTHDPTARPPGTADYLNPPDAGGGHR